MQGLSIILSLFCNDFNKFNNAGARLLDSIYHMTLKQIFGTKMSRICHFLCSTIMDVII